MDMTKVGEKAVTLVKKYRYVILVLVLGIGLMSIPTKNKDTKTNTAAEITRSDESEDLSAILKNIDGAGEVQVLLTRASSETVVYQLDQDTVTSDTSDTLRYETVIITDSERAEQGLVQKTLAPDYRGAIIVCEGADNPGVRLSIVEAVSKATGLGADKISVLKMK